MKRITKTFKARIAVTLQPVEVIENKTKYIAELLTKDAIFDSDDFCAPTNWDKDKIVAGFLGFALLQPGDTDAEYFAKHTPEYLKWLSTPEADELRLWVNDIENS